MATEKERERRKRRKLAKREAQRAQPPLAAPGEDEFDLAKQDAYLASIGAGPLEYEIGLDLAEPGADQTVYTEPPPAPPDPVNESIARMALAIQELATNVGQGFSELAKGQKAQGAAIIQLAGRMDGYEEALQHIEQSAGKTLAGQSGLGVAGLQGQFGPSQGALLKQPGMRDVKAQEALILREEGYDLPIPDPDGHVVLTGVTSESEAIRRRQLLYGGNDGRGF